MAQSQVSKEIVMREFDAQLAHALKKPDNCSQIAKALGRSAGIAKELGFDKVADVLWEKVLSLEPQHYLNMGHIRMPGINEMYEGYKAAPQESFDRFIDKEIYPTTSGLAFPEAMGNYAAFVDSLCREGKDTFDITYSSKGAIEALHATGFERQAMEIERMVQQMQQAKVKTAEKTIGTKGR